MNRFQHHQTLALLLLLAANLVSGLAFADIIHRERSLYSTILVEKRGPLVCLQFSVRDDLRSQSCKDQSEPRKLVFGYAKMMLSSLLLQPEPDRVLVVGLGGGTLPTVLNQLYPQASIDIVEIDDAVKTVAETYFGFEENDRMKVTIQDARVFTKRAVIRGEKYDLVMLDAFNGDYIPEHLMTREYLEETKALLAENGVLAANTFASSRLYDHESNTYQAVFGEFYNVTINSSRNRIVIARAEPLPVPALLNEAAREMAPALRSYDLRITDFPRSFSTRVDWDETARILTDQYSPANLLRNQ